MLSCVEHEKCFITSGPDRTALEEESWIRGYKTFFMVSCFEHEILNAHKNKNIKN